MIAELFTVSIYEKYACWKVADNDKAEFSREATEECLHWPHRPTEIKLLFGCAMVTRYYAVSRGENPRTMRLHCE